MSQQKSEQLLELFKNNFKCKSKLDKKFIEKILNLNSVKQLVNNRQIVYVSGRSYTVSYTKTQIFINTQRTIYEVLYYLVVKGRFLQTYKYRPNTLKPKEAIGYYRLLHGDNLVWLIRVLWEIKLSNIDRNMFDVFKSELEYGLYSSVFNEYKVTAQQDFKTLENGIVCENTLIEFLISVNQSSIDVKCIQSLLSEKVEIKDNLYTVIEECFKLNHMCYIKHNTIQDEKFKEILTNVTNLSHRNFIWFLEFETSCDQIEQQLTIQKQSDTIQPTCKIIDFQKYKEK